MPDWQKCLFCGAMLGVLRAELEFIAGSMQGKTLDLDRDVTTLGTAAGNTILLNDTGVSRKHVGIRRLEASYEVADLGSTNGVYVNGERVKKPRQLNPGDVIRVGATEMVFKS
jgi:pSer/pThr/pTyr-binding forkhead associated (FHA) protein